MILSQTSIEMLSFMIFITSSASIRKLIPKWNTRALTFSFQQSASPVINECKYNPMHNIPQLAVLREAKTWCFFRYFTFSCNKNEIKKLFQLPAKIVTQLASAFQIHIFFSSNILLLSQRGIIHKVVKSSRFTGWLSGWNIYSNVIIIPYKRNWQKLVRLVCLRRPSWSAKRGTLKTVSHIVFRMLNALRRSVTRPRVFTWMGFFFKFCMWFESL